MSVSFTAIWIGGVPVKHQEYIRLVPGAKTAVLFIHGIMGTPDHFLDLIPHVPRDWSVCNILLPGHGKSVSDFGASSMDQWRSRANQVFDRLCQDHERVVLVAHSMGTLFSVQMASRRPEKVPFMFFLAPPMKICVKPAMVANSLRVAFHCVREDNPRQTATRDACSIQTTLKLWEYISWIPRFLELFREVKDTQKLLPDMRVPCFVYISGKDEMVSPKAGAIMKKSPTAIVHLLPDSCHFYYAPEDKAFLISEFQKRCLEIS